ncbi:MAG: CHASE2 domain-containing protein, partial [Pseudomonadota bacterium]
MYAFQAKFSEVLIARVAIVWTVLVWTTVSGLTPFGIFQPADRGLQDLTSQLAPSAPTRDDIVIVSIDAQSFKHFGDRWPWTRDRHAALLDAA